MTRLGSSWHPPKGYREGAIGGTLVVARAESFDGIVSALAMGTLHAWASTRPGAVAMQGRGTAWATRLPDGSDVVVRHSIHGGMLRGITRDFFLAPTRAPEELEISERLRGMGIRTPQVVGYAVYSAFGPLCRADVVTARIDGVDLLTALHTQRDKDERDEIRLAVSRLLEALWEAGAHHPDLNAKNILIAGGERRDAYVIDVDRVTFGRPRDERTEQMWANGRRLQRSLLKLQVVAGLELSPNEARALSSFSPPSAHAVIAADEP